MDANASEWPTGLRDKGRYSLSFHSRRCRATTITERRWTRLIVRRLLVDACHRVTHRMPLAYRLHINIFVQLILIQ